MWKTDRADLGISEFRKSGIILPDEEWIGNPLLWLVFSEG